MRVWRLLLTLIWLVAAPGLLQAKQLALIADTRSAVSNLAASDLTKIFNAHIRNWPDGRQITIVMRDPSSEEMQLVLRKLLNMTPDQARAFIQAHPGAIVVADSDDTVLRVVLSTRGAIGVIDLYSLSKDVKVLKIDGKLPVEPGYMLRGN
ncbi:MAG: hypothetical protein NVS9B5_37130 [Terriglobales bacterium]